MNTAIQKVIKDVDVSGVVNVISNRRSVVDIKREMSDIQEILKDVMVEGQHYGNIPGCGDKKCLLKPGAEKLSMTFRLRPIINNVGDIITQTLPNNHINISVFCHIISYNGDELATGIGSCSTMESKYRYRGGEKKGTGKPVPKEYWNLKKEGKAKEAHALIGGAGFSPGKINGEWQICSLGEKMENPDIADTYNTVLKMAKKRAYVDGILSATCASDIFTQDVEADEAGVVVPSEKRASSPTTYKEAIDSNPEVFTASQNTGEFGNKIITAVQKITSKPGVGKEKKDKDGNVVPGKPYTIYTIYGEGDTKYSTFDKTLAEGAKTAQESGIKVSIVTKGDKYNSILSLDLVEPDFSDPAASQNPESADLLSEQGDIDELKTF